MTIKKPIRKATPAEVPAATEQTAGAPAAGGATIADRFKLDMPDPKAAKAVSTVADKIALCAALLGLAAAGFLAFTLWQHWQFLMPA